MPPSFKGQKMQKTEWIPIESAEKEDWKFVLLRGGGYNGQADEAYIGFWDDEGQCWRAWFACCSYAPEVTPTQYIPIPSF
jgi:hypothetical protein